MVVGDLKYFFNDQSERTDVIWDKCFDGMYAYMNVIKHIIKLD